jgi:hypothetical protein
MMDEWGKGNMLPGSINESMNASYPYVLADGITIYYAADGPASMGGYDIFVTRYNTNTDTYLTPENVGMPFNSPYNDYMYVIDEFNNLGWFASDRYQPEGKVCVYVFIPASSKQVYNYESMDKNKLIKLAQLHSIRDTWTNESLVADARKRLQETMQESNYIQNIDQSVTQNGVTVTLTDSIQDQGFLYAFFEVKTEDSISMTDHTSFEEMTHFKIDGKEVYAVDDNRFGSFNTGVGQDILLKTDQNSAHLKYFNACISYDSDYDLSNKTVEITLKNLTEEEDYDKTVITDGTWDFKWTLGAVKPPTTLEVNRKCDFGGYEITVKKMEVTPLLWSLYLDYDEAMKVYEDEKNKFEYTGTDYGMDLYARTSIDQVRYKDGTVLTLDRTMGGIAGGGEKQDKENGVMIIRNSFPQLVDVDNQQAVHFGNIDQWLEVRE